MMNSTVDQNGNFHLNWTQIVKKETCFATPGETWASRNDQTCSTVWPEGRTGHSLVYFDKKLYLFGGYQTTLPYPLTSSAGAGPGVQPASYQGFVPYPQLPYYLNDFWVFDITTGVWTVVTPVSTVRKYYVIHSHYQAAFFFNI